MPNSTLYLNQDENNILFQSLTIEQQKILLEFHEFASIKQQKLVSIANYYHDSDLNEIDNHEWKHEDDIELGDASDSDIIDEVEHRSWSNSEAQEIFEAIEDLLTLDSYTMENVLSNMNDDEVDKLVSGYFNNYQTTTLWDTSKLDILLKISQKYSYLELEEKVKELNLI